MSTMNVLDSVGATVAVEKPLVPGQAPMASSRPVAIASDQSAIPVSGTITSLSQFAGSAINLGAGAVGTGTLRITQASDSPLVASLGATSDAAWTSGNGSAIALLKTVAANASSTSPSSVVGPGEWETVAASQTDQVLGPTGATGDYISHLLIVPGTTSPGAVTIKDGAGSAISVFAGGASSVTTLIPFPVPLCMRSLAGAWKVTTGTNVTVIGVGDFT